MSTNTTEKYSPVPEFLYVIFGSDKQVYYFDTEWDRTTAYLQFIRNKISNKSFFVKREDDQQKILELW